jgi:hypothetical protein
VSHIDGNSSNLLTGDHGIRGRCILDVGTGELWFGAHRPEPDRLKVVPYLDLVFVVRSSSMKSDVEHSLCR